MILKKPPKSRISYTKLISELFRLDLDLIHWFLHRAGLASRYLESNLILIILILLYFIYKFPSEGVNRRDTAKEPWGFPPVRSFSRILHILTLLLNSYKPYFNSDFCLLQTHILTLFSLLTNPYFNPAFFPLINHILPLFSPLTQHILTLFSPLLEALGSPLLQFQAAKTRGTRRTLSFSSWISRWIYPLDKYENADSKKKTKNHPKNNPNPNTK